ncbi:MAG: methionyl-tRNA formyltransferase [Pseudomonadales bacterium]|nr:methionyl-tRNA formyltransferase [Pseudomonadales bacterium]
MKILFAGTPDFAATHLEALLRANCDVCGVITQPDKPGKRGKRLVPPPVKELATAHDLPVLQPAKLNAADIAPFDADIMVVVAYGQILPAAVLGVPGLGCINVHASLLPRWRGAAPIQQAILAGDTVTGITIMQMDEGMDTGDMLLRKELAVDEDDTTATLGEKLARLGAEALPDLLEELARGACTRVPQDDSQASYAGKIAKADAHVSWAEGAVQIARKVRAFNPDPVAWTMLDELRIRLWHARALPGDATEAPGTIVDLSKAGVTVACGDECLLVSSLQLPLGKGSILSGADILNARKDLLAPGKRFH